MNNNKPKSLSMSSALANLSRPNVIKRSQSASGIPSAKCVRVVVLGVGGVGKTAMTVRFITKRFIGDYDPTLETIYKHTTVVDDELVNFEIMDTAGQEENSPMLEDKCKWGESFIFVYDVTDRYSFNNLSQLKFIASYSHSRIRVNFTPVWILVGNKADLATHERMVSPEEGRNLAKDLGCHMFREISVKESMDQSSEVFEDLWREFSKRSPRSPSSSQRRKFSYRIQDKIPTLNSNASTCASEAIKGQNGDAYESIVSSLTSTFRRQASAPVLPISRSSKEQSEINNNEFDNARNIAIIPEDAVSVSDKDSLDEKVTSRPPRSRKNAIAAGAEKISTFQRGRRKALCKALSVDNVFKNLEEHNQYGSNNAAHNCDTTPMLSSSSTSSSTTSLNGPTSPTATKQKPADKRTRSGSDASGIPRNAVGENVDELVFLYQEHCRRTRARRCDSSFKRLSGGFPSPLSLASTYEVGGF